MTPPQHALRVRVARPADVPHLVSISAPFVAGGTLRARSHDGFEARIRDFTILEQGHRAVGCYGLRRVTDGGRYADYLYNFCVDQQLHGLGVGGRLLAEAVDASRESGSEALYAATNRADPWFEDRGFVPPDPGDDIARGLYRLMDSSRGSRLLMLQFLDCRATAGSVVLQA